MVPPPDQKWGALDVNGTWNGMVGMVHRKEVEFALGLNLTTALNHEILANLY
jgi:hypothetical protein